MDMAQRVQYWSDAVKYKWRNTKQEMTERQICSNKM
jgi:hypothetical protein